MRTARPTRRSAAGQFSRRARCTTPASSRGRRCGCGYRIDLVVEGLIVVELKAVEKLTPVHEAQILSYLKLSGCSIGLLINFNVRMLTQGLKRFALDYRPDPNL